MGGTVLRGVVAASMMALAGSALAGGAGGFHGGIRIPAGHWGGGGARWAGGGWRGGARPLPPVAGVIHERPGMRPFYSAYGHTNTGAVPFAAGGRGGWGGDRGAAYGHVSTALHGYYGGRRYAGNRIRTEGGGRWERGRLAGGRRFAIYRPGLGYIGYGGVYAGGYPGYGVGGYDLGPYDQPGTYGTPGTYGAPGSYGHYGTEAGGAAPYLSEPPLAATRTEAPLAPSPYGPDGGYYAPRARHAAPHVVTLGDRSRAGCACAAPAGAYPTIYRYGVGTAY